MSVQLKFLFALFLFSTIYGCKKSSSEFFPKEMRLKMRAYEANLLFTNYHISECDKFIELKSQVVLDSLFNIKVEYKVVLNFLEGSEFKFQGKMFEVDKRIKTIEFPNIDFRDENIDYTFELNQQSFTFPKIEQMIPTNPEQLNEIKIGAILNWKSSDTNEKILFAIKPSSKYCGKEKPDGSKYGTRPMLTNDDGEHIFSEKDFATVSSGIDAGILLKRGKNEIHQFQLDDKEYDICVSTISFSSLKTKVME